MPWMKPAILMALLLLGGCADWNERFSRECRRAATIEVLKPNLWHEYLVQLRHSLKQMRAGLGDAGAVRNPPQVNEFIRTEGFLFTNSWVLRGQPIMPRRQVYENDYFVIESKTGTMVARIGNLSLTTPTFGYTKSWSCIYDYPQLYRRRQVRAGLED